jgi:hypothetical protein
MSTRFRLFRILLPLLALWLASCELSAQSGGTSDDTHSSIAVSGRVLTQESKPLSAVVVHLRKANLSDTTDSEGKFALVGDTLVAANSSTGTLDTLDYLRDGILVHSAPVQTWIETMPDVYLVQRDISGALSEIPSQPTNVVAKIWNTRGQSISIDLDLNTATKRFSGFAWFRSTGGLDSFRIQIRATDAKDRPTGQSQELSFTSRAGDLLIPDFDPNNLRPRITFTLPPTGKRGATIALHAEVKNLTGWGIQYEWSIGSGSWRKGRSDTTFAIPGNAPDLLTVRVRAMRSDSLATTDSVALRIVDSPVEARRNARPLVANSNPLSGAIRDGQVDWFKFPVDSGATYSVQQGCPHDPCPSARTLSAFQGSSITSFSLATGGLLRFTAIKTDSVYISFEGKSTVDGVESMSFGYWDSANYSLGLTKTITPRSAARALPLDRKPLTGTLRKEQVDWFKFVADSGTSYDIEPGCLREPCPLARTMNAYWGTSNSTFNSSTFNGIHFVASKSETVYISFEGKSTANGVTYTSFESNDSADYSMTLISSGYKTNARINATPLAVSDSQSGVLHNRELIWFKFPVESGITYSVQTTCSSEPYPSYPCTDYRFLNAYIDSNNTPFATSTSKSHLSFTAAKNGTAYVSIGGQTMVDDRMITSFILSLTSSAPTNPTIDPPDTIALSSARTLATDGSIVQSSLAKTEIVWYKFQAEGNTPYRIQKSCNTPSCLMGNKITVFAYPSKEVIATTGAGILEFTNPNPGVLRVKFEGATSEDAGPYTLWAIKYDTVKAASMNTAIELLPGSTSPIRLAKGISESTWFRFRGDSGSTYTLTFPTAEFDDYAFSIWNIDSVTVPGSTLSNESIKRTFACIKSGTYFIRIAARSQWGRFSGYSVRLESKHGLPYWYTGVDDYEPDSTMHTASVLSPDSTVSHHTLTPTDIDWSKFHVDSGKTYLIYLEKPQKPYSFGLYSSDSTLLQFLSANPGHNSLPIAVGGQLAMTYLADSSKDLYVRIGSYGDSSQYDLRVWPLAADAYEPDNTTETAKPIPTDGSVQHHILNGTYDYIKLHVEAGKRYWVDVSTGSFCILYPGNRMDFLRGVGPQLFAPDSTMDAFIEVKPQNNTDYSNSPAAYLINTWPYSVSVTEERNDIHEPDNELSSASKQTSNDSTSTHFLTVNDVDWISFDVDSGATYSIKVSNLSKAYLTASLFTADSSQIGNVVKGYDATVSLQATARRKTTYNLQVTSPWYSGPPVKYDVTITRSSP